MKNDTFIKLLVNYYIKYGRKIIILFVFLSVAFLTLPRLIVWPSVGLDPSWKIGLRIASIEKMQFGKEIVFTYGSLGFLYLPVFSHYSIWVISVIFTLFVHCLFLYSMYSMIKTLSLNIPDIIVMGIVLIFALPMTSIGYKLLFSIEVLFFLIIAYDYFRKYEFLIYIVICFLLAVASLMKFNTLIISLNIFVLMNVYYIYRKQYLYLPMICGMYASSLLLLLYLAGQNISSFYAYLLNDLEMSSGFSSGMSLNGSKNDIIIGLSVMGFWLIILLVSVLKRQKKIVFFILLNAGFIFISFKHGFIRHDDHVFKFFGNMLLLLLIIAFIFKKDSMPILQHISFVFVCILIGFIYSGYPSLLSPNIKAKYKNIYSTVSLLSSSSLKRDAIQENNKSNMRDKYNLNAKTLECIDDKTVNVMPWEISLSYAYDMNWSPMPVIQSYQANTSKLDSLNADHYEGNKSSEYILYSLNAIDRRYHLFDTPETFRAILKNYKPVFIDGDYLLLQKRDVPYSFSTEYVSSVEAKIGESISIPKIEGGLIFANVYMGYNLEGKILNFLYKVPYAFIRLYSGENKYQHRFIFPTAENGIFLSQYVLNIEDMMEIWTNKPLNNLDSFTILVGNENFYDKNIHVEFFRLNP